MKKNGGVDLIELIIVMAILAIIAIIAIPNVAQQWMRDREAAAVNSLRDIHTAQIAFRDANEGKYAATFDELATVASSFGDKHWPGVKRGYKFSLSGGGDNFSAIAEPVTPGESGRYYYYVDRSGVVRYDSALSVDARSNPVEPMPKVN